MAPKAKKKTISLNEFAGDEFRQNALPTESEGAPLQKGKGKKGDRDGDRGGDRGGFRRDDGAEGADTGAWRGERSGFGDRGGKGKGGGGDFGDRGAGGFGGGGRKERTDEPSRADEGNWFKKETPGGAGGFGGNRGNDRGGERGGERGGDRKFGGGGGFSRADETDAWRRGDEPSGDTGESRRPVLKLKPRTKPSEGDDAEKNDGSSNASKSNPFGGARAVDINKKLADAGRDFEGAKKTGEQNDEEGGGWRSRMANKSSAAPTAPAGDGGWRSREAQKSGGDDKWASKSSGRSFENLRNREPASQNKKEDVEEEDDGWVKIDKTGPSNKTAQKKDSQEDESLNKGQKKNKFEMIESDEGSDEEEELKAKNISEVTKSSAKSEEDLQESPKEELAEKQKTASSAGGKYIPPSQKKKIEEDAARDKERAQREEERRQQQEAQRVVREAENERQRRKQEEADELDRKQNAKKYRELEEIQRQQNEILAAKKRQQEEKERKKHMLAQRKNRFNPKHVDLDLCKKFEDTINSNWPKPKLDAFDVKSIFSTEEELEQNIHYAILLLCRKVLYNSTTEDMMKYAIENMAPVFEKVLADADMQGRKDEILYAAATVVATEMRNSDKKLPDFTKDTSVIESFFYEMYAANVVPEQFLLRWFEDLDDESEGRVDVVFQVTPVINWIKFEEEEEDDEPDSEDEEDEDMDVPPNGSEGISSAKTRY